MTKYSTIVADPPWQTKAGRPLGDYRIEDGKQVFGARGNVSRPLPYATMKLQDICALRIPAADNAHLYLWVTNQYMPHAFRVIDAWGFKYSTILVWCKNPMGGGLGGNYRITTEYLLFCTRGKLPAKRQHIGTWFNWKRPYKNGYPCHSKKPPEAYQLVESVSPGPYLDMFARDERQGWDVWGNEVNNSIVL